MFGAGYAGAARPPLPDGRPAPHRPRRTRLLPRRLQRRRRRRASGGSRPTPKPTCEKQLDAGAADLRRARASRRSKTSDAYVDGINAYIAAAQRRPDKLKPAEYALLGQADGTVEADRRDRDRLADRRHLRPGRRQRAELGADDAGASSSAIRRKGRAQGLARLPLQERPRSADDDLQALPVRDPQRLRQARPGAARPGQRRASPTAPPSSASAAPARRPSTPSARQRCRRALEARRPRLQLGAGLGQALGDRAPDRGDGAAGRLLRPADPDGGGPARSGHRRPRRRLPRRQPLRRSSATAATTPGARRRRPPTTSTPSPRSSARTTSTTSTSGKCLPMEKLEKTESWTPNAIDSTAAGSQTLTAYRTVHGIVYARGKVHGQEGRVRPAQRSTYFHEADSVIGFAQLNEPGVVTGPQRLQEGGLEHQLPLQLVLRRLRTHRLRALGLDAAARARAPRPTSRSSAPASTTGRASTRATQTADWLPFAKHPQAVDPPLPRLLEQQAGAGLGGGRRQVRLRADVPLADDRRQGHRRRPRASRR